ncbi:MAG: hypothetical protein RL434_1031, partial [Pseudomonadota bacterium]
MARTLFKKPAARAAARAVVARMTLEGAGQHQIAEALGCSQPAVSGHQRALAQEWRESAAQEIGEHRARILAEL